MTIMSDLPDYVNINSLSNLEIYKPMLKDNIDLIILKYLQIIEDYVNLFMENIKTDSENYFKYLLINGLKTINNVFILILTYSRNLDITYLYSEKSYFIYIEFVSQIDNQNHSFLQLNGKDASLFVYKKTIYEIDSNIKKDYVCKEKEKLDLLNSFSNILFKLFNFQEEQESSNIEFKKYLNNTIKINFNILYKIANLLSLKIYSQESQIKYTKLVFSYIELFINHLIIYLKNSNNNLEKMDLFIDALVIKLKKHKINENNLKQINTHSIKDLINKTPKKLIDNLIE